MSSLLVVMVLLADGKGTVEVDSVTVNGEKTEGNVSGAASTASGTGQQWSVVTARTVGARGNALEAGVGFPGVHATFLHGMTDVFDLGGRVSVNYGWEGMVNTIWPGLKLQGVVRYKFMDNGKLNLGAHAEPGLLFYFPRGGGTWVGFAIPIGLTLGIVASSALNVAVNFEVPLWILFGTRSSAIIPILMGAGVEYFLTSALALFFDLRMGPSIWTAPGNGAVFTFQGKLGVGWRF